jgi:uncharacterized membrane protein
MTQNDHMAVRYLSRFRIALQRYRVPHAEEIVDDLRNHISEAKTSDKSYAEIVAALGSPDKLARAYAVELLIDPPKDTPVATVIRFLKILSLIIAESFVSLCIAVTLGSFGISLLLAGPAMVIGGILEAVGAHPWWINTGNLPPLAVVALGPVTSAFGWGACWLLWRYVRMMSRRLRKVLPQNQPGLAI